MAYVIKFDFRSTVGYVTDPANCTYVIDTDAYPTVRAGFTFGYTSSLGIINPRDRDTSFPRIAGIHFTSSTTLIFQFDAPIAGSTDVELGSGDWASSNFVGTHVVKDNTSTLFTISHNTSVNGIFDANDNDRTGTGWNSSATARTVTFTTTTIKLEVSVGPSTVGAIAHFGLTNNGAAGDTLMAQCLT